MEKHIELARCDASSTALCRYLTTAEAAEQLGVSSSYLAKLRCMCSTGPAFVKLGRSVRYRSEDLDAWAERHVRRSTSDIAA